MLNLLALTWVDNPTSPSEPGANNPFCGHRPNNLAGIALVNSTKRSGVIRPVITPLENSNCMRFSTPGKPFGQRLKSPLEICRR